MNQKLPTHYRSITASPDNKITTPSQVLRRTGCSDLMQLPENLNGQIIKKRCLYIQSKILNTKNLNSN